MAKPTIPGAKGLAKKAVAKTTGAAKKAAAPGQLKKAAGVQSAKTFTKGATKKKSL